MTLKELAPEYRASAERLRLRLRELRCAVRSEADEQARFHLKRRIQTLTEMLTQMNDLAELTAHYYERSYHRNAKYRL